MCDPAGCCHTSRAVSLAVPALVLATAMVAGTAAAQAGDVLAVALVAVYGAAAVMMVVTWRLVRWGTLRRPRRVAAAPVARAVTARPPLAIEAPQSPLTCGATTSKVELPPKEGA